MNSQPKTLAIKTWLKEAAKELTTKGISSARLDAEIILAHTLRKPRTYLHAHEDKTLSIREHEIADARLQLRLEHTPVAYIIGHKEFYGRQFKVTPATLIPRPESETMIDLLKKYRKRIKGNRLVDIGTGCGCLGISAKLEFPELETTLIDTSRYALHVAETNAAYHKATVSLLRSDLLTNYPFAADIILANLPYVDKKWARSPETEFEPAEALFASDEGLYLIKRLLLQTEEFLAPSGLVLLEADPRQHKEIVRLANKNTLKHLASSGFIVVFQKV